MRLFEVSRGRRMLLRATLAAGLFHVVQLAVKAGRGMIELARGRYPEALAAIQTAERLGTLLVTEHTLARRGKSHRLQALVRMGETRRVEHVLAEMDGAERDSGEIRVAVAALRLAQEAIVGRRAIPVPG